VETGSTNPWRWPLLVAAVIVLLAAALWYGKLRPRASAAEVQQTVGLNHPGAVVGCVPVKSNGSLWGCAVVYRAESECLAVAVSLTGKIDPGGPSQHHCSTPQLLHLLPHSIAAKAVAFDVTRAVGGRGAGFTCARMGHGTVRWACARSVPAQRCVLVKVVRWRPLKLTDGGPACGKVPQLRMAVGGLS
jgi:hypothetical protein